MKGVVYWRLSESFKARLWNERRSVKELEASLIETQKRAVQVQQARTGVPTNTGAFGTRVGAIAKRMDDMQERLAALTQKQSHFLEDLAVEELGRQKQRIETYQVQARFELAAIYDKTANKPDKPAGGKATGPGQPGDAGSPTGTPNPAGAGNPQGTGGPSGKGNPSNPSGAGGPQPQEKP
jgi:hypothetical protein